MCKAVFRRDLQVSGRFWFIITVLLTGLLVILGATSTAMKSHGDIMIQQFYTLFASLIPTLYIAVTANKLIAAQVDNGALSYPLAAGVKRTQYALTQGVFLYGSVVLSYLILTAAGALVCAFTGIGLETGQLMLLNLGSLLFNLAVCGIAYFATCTFNSSAMSLMVGAGIPVAFQVIHMVADLGAVNEKLDFFKYLTLNTLFDMDAILAYSADVIWQFGVFLAVAVLGFVSGMVIFQRRDLPL